MYQEMSIKECTWGLFASPPNKDGHPARVARVSPELPLPLLLPRALSYKLRALTDRSSSLPVREA